MAIIDRLRADEALDWVRRIHDSSFSDWEAHAAWLDADPRNLEAFDEASLAIAMATSDLASPRPYVGASQPSNDNLPDMAARPRSWSRWSTGFGMAIAAGLVAVVATPSMMQTNGQSYFVQTGAGERRTVTLDGTTIALNGDSRLKLDHSNQRIAELERGEAFFTVRHDAVHPFAVHAGAATFQDVGTAFDVVQRAGMTQVSVREGAVLYDPGGSAVRLDGGQSMRIAANTASVQTVDTAAVGGWQSGRLLYRDAPLSDVAHDISRSIGEPVEVDGALAQRRFNGVVMIDPDRPLMFRRMAGVMGIDIHRASQGWRMVMPNR